MNLKEFSYKAYNKLNSRFVVDGWNAGGYYEKYCSKYSAYRNMRKNKATIPNGCSSCNYMSARPNPGAGIGHQIANWIAGCYYTKYFGLKFAHIPFSSAKNPFVANAWDEFLGFGNGEVTVAELKKKGYKIVRLPLFDEFNEKHIEIIRSIISTYSDEKAVFLLEQDQFYRDQYGVMTEIQEKFHNNPRRNSSGLIYDSDEFNIAVHVRRGDIDTQDRMTNENLRMRWIPNDYFVKAIKTAASFIKTEKPYHIYVFSQGNIENFSDFKEFDCITFCLDMDAKSSFEHMVYADALITSKSSFSYKPALINRQGIKFVPDNFWHGYPDSDDWVILDEDGSIIERNKESETSS